MVWFRILKLNCKEENIFFYDFGSNFNAHFLNIHSMKIVFHYYNSKFIYRVDFLRNHLPDRLASFWARSLEFGRPGETHNTIPPLLITSFVCPHQNVIFVNGMQCVLVCSNDHFLTFEVTHDWEALFKNLHQSHFWTKRTYNQDWKLHHMRLQWVL